VRSDFFEVGSVGFMNKCRQEKVSIFYLFGRYSEGGSVGFEGFKLRGNFGRDKEGHRERGKV
jgi:hypothetical protein